MSKKTNIVDAGAPVTDESPILNIELTDEEVASTPPSVLEKLKGFVSRACSGPVIGQVVDSGRDGLIIAGRMRIGGAYNAMMREKVARKLLPSAMHPYVLDNPTGAALFDVAHSHLGTGAIEVFRPHLPPLIQNYGMGLMRCATTESWTRTLQTIDFESFMSNFVSGEFLKLAREAQELQL